MHGKISDMIEIGQIQKLLAYKEVKHGVYLEDGEGNEVLLPSKEVPRTFKVDDEIEVFIYLDDQGRKIATTKTPKINLYEFAFLTCVDVAPFGSFMDWGLDRDLLIPNGEMSEPMYRGRDYLVYLFLDEQDRLTGTTHIDRCVANDDCDLEVGQEVSLLVYGELSIGIRVIIDQQYDGLLYKNQVQKELKPGDLITGYVTRIREDEKIDVSIHRFGYKKVLDAKGTILEALRTNNGVLKLHDKSTPEEIKSKLEMSKKVFKKTIGALYKERIIEIGSEGIKLLPKK